jgi:hypothetical protein
LKAEQDLRKSTIFYRIALLIAALADLGYSNPLRSPAPNAQEIRLITEDHLKEDLALLFGNPKWKEILAVETDRCKTPASYLFLPLAPGR